MWDQINRIMQQTVEQTADAVAGFLPGLILLIVILAGTVAIAVIVRALLLRVLRGLDVDRRAADAGFAGSVGLPQATSVSVLIARLAQWTVILIGVLIGLTTLDAAMPGRFALRIFDYLPNVLAAAVILVVGILLSRFLARSVLIGAVNLQIHSARLLAIGMKWLVLVMAGAMALEHLGIGRQILLLAFGILFGGIVLTMALAIGLGSKDLISRSWEQVQKAPKEEDKLNHL